LGLRTVRNAADPQHRGRGVRNAAAKVSAAQRTKQIKEQTIKQGRALRGVAALNRDQAGASDFNAFWAAYPSRKPHANPKQPARKKFEVAVRRGIPPDTIIRGAANYRAAVERNRTEARYVAQALTWLNQERWNDYQEAPDVPRLRARII
jgi:hypothetical protein